MALLDYTLSKLLLGEKLEQLQLAQQQAQAQRDAQMLTGGAQALQNGIQGLTGFVQTAGENADKSFTRKLQLDSLPGAGTLAPLSPSPATPPTPDVPKPDAVTLDRAAPAAPAYQYTPPRQDYVSLLTGDAQSNGQSNPQPSSWLDALVPGASKGLPPAPAAPPAQAAPAPAAPAAPKAAPAAQAAALMSKPLAEPSPMRWEQTPEQQADAFLASRGMKPGQSSWLSQLAGVPEDNYDFHRTTVINNIKNARRATEEKAFADFRDQQKLDLERRLGESTIAKNLGEADRAKGAEGGRQAQLSKLAAGAMAPLAATLKDQLNSDDPNEVIAAQQQLRDAATKGLVEAGIDITDPKEQVAVKAAMQVGLEDTMKDKKKRDLDEKSIEAVRAANTNIDRLGRLEKLREQANFAPTTLQILRNQLDNVDIPVNVGGVLTFNLGKINDKLVELQKHGDLTPAQVNYLGEAYALKNEMAKIANGGFNITDGDAKRIDVGLFDPYSTPEEYRARMTSLKYTLTNALKQRVDDLNPTFKLPTGIVKTVQARELPADYVPQQGDDVAFGHRPDAVDPARAVGDQVGQIVGAIPAVGAGVLGGAGKSLAGSIPVDKVTNPIDTLTSPSEAEYAARPTAPKAKPVPPSPNPARDSAVDDRLGGRLAQLQAAAAKAGVDPNALSVALSGTSFTGDALYRKGQQYIQAHRRR